MIFDDMDINMTGFMSFQDYCSFMAMQTNERKLSSGASFRMSNAASSKLLSTARLGTQEKPYIVRFVLDLQSSLDILQANATDGEVEACAFFIHHHLANEYRGFHSTERVFQISELADPTQMIAALFQDIIYYEIDGGLSDEAKDVLQGVIDEDDPYRISNSMKPENDRLISMVMVIFNLKPGQRVFPISKFLCSCVAVRMLQNMLPIRQLAKIVACIKATETQRDTADDEFYNHLVTALPTTGYENIVGKKERSHRDDKRSLSLSLAAAAMPTKGMELNDLFAGMMNANRVFDLDMTEAKVVKAVQRAADMSNRTHGAFCDEDYIASVESVWGLLPEITPALRQKKMATVFDYHQGVVNLLSTLGALDPNTLFVSFRSVPGRAELNAFIRNANKNINFAIRYTRVKIVTMAILSALLKLTGGNIPMGFIADDEPVEINAEKRVGADLPIFRPEELAQDCKPRLYETFVSRHSAHQSPVSAFIYGAMGESVIEVVLAHADYPMTEDRANELLESVPYGILHEISMGLGATLRVSRWERIEELLDYLCSKKSSKSSGKSEREDSKMPSVSEEDLDSKPRATPSKVAAAASPPAVAAVSPAAPVTPIMDAPVAPVSVAPKPVPTAECASTRATPPAVSAKNGTAVTSETKPVDTGCSCVLL
mmetsp:Transcript_19415/g.29948  ORF Transcript_19415/g.29948 Transcript_19415/m.29948 type:complete len:659 (+) Transcript_19415:530-2506(+)